MKICMSVCHMSFNYVPDRLHSTCVSTRITSPDACKCMKKHVCVCLSAVGGVLEANVLCVYIYTYVLDQEKHTRTNVPKRLLLNLQSARLQLGKCGKVGRR